VEKLFRMGAGDYEFERYMYLWIDAVIYDLIGFDEVSIVSHSYCWNCNYFDWGGNGLNGNCTRYEIDIEDGYGYICRFWE
jgi:hypothetical protein